MTARTSLLSLLAAVLIGAAVALLPRAALACSAGDDWNPARESAVIVAGRVTAMELAPLIPSRGPVPSTVAVTLTFAVDRYLKGTGPSELRAVDTSSVTFFKGETAEQMARFEGAQYLGTSGACGALQADPRGRYVVYGLLRAEDGSLRTNLLTTFGTGTGPNDPAIVAAVARAEASLAATPSATASDTPRTTPSTTPLAAAPPTTAPTTVPTTSQPVRTSYGVDSTVIWGGLVVAALAIVLTVGLVAQSRRPR